MKSIGVAMLVLAGLGSAPTSAAETATTTATATELKLESISPREAVTALRTLTGTRDFEIIDDRTLRTTGDADKVAVARAVIELIEHPSAATAEIPMRALPAGEMLASVRLEHASPPDVMAALRNLRIARIVVSTEPTVVAIRDTPGQVEAALNTLRDMESVQGH